MGSTDGLQRSGAKDLDLQHRGVRKVGGGQYSEQHRIWLAPLSATQSLIQHADGRRGRRIRVRLHWLLAKIFVVPLMFDDLQCCWW